MSIPVISPADSQWWKQLLSGSPADAASAIGAKSFAEPVKEATPMQIEHAVKEVNASLQSRSVGLQFELDREADKVIVKVIDRASGEVIRQIPTEEVVRIAKVLGNASGLLVSQAA